MRKGHLLELLILLEGLAYFLACLLVHFLAHCIACFVVLNCACVGGTGIIKHFVIIILEMYGVL